MVSFVGSFVWLNFATANVWFNSDFILLSEFSYTYLHQASKHQQEIYVKKQNWTPSVRRYPHWHLFSSVSFFPLAHTFILFLFYHVSFCLLFLFSCYFFTCYFFSTTLLLFFCYLFSCYFFSGPKLLLFFLFLYLHPDCYLYSCYFFSCYFFPTQNCYFFSCYPFSCYFLSEHRSPYGSIFHISAN